MPTAFSKLQRASWQGPGGSKIEFPVRRVVVAGSARYHVHEYPHAPGGAFEALGRKLYEVRMSCPFMETFALYPGLWPLDLDTLRSSFERQDLGKLNIPTLGTISARCVKWTQTADSRVQSGEDVELEFLEDQSQLFLIDFLVAQDTAKVQDAFTAFDVRAAATGSNQSVFDAVRSAANQVLAYVDQAQLASNVLAAKIDGLTAIIQEVDADALYLQQPENYAVWNAMRDLYAAAVQLSRDVLGKRASFATYVVPMTMGISEVSAAIYGDNTHAVELLQLNNVEDAFSIPAATRINYYPPDA